MKISHTAPQTAEISLAKQQPTKVQLHRPDFDNGMKTEQGIPYVHSYNVAPPGL